MAGLAAISTRNGRAPPARRPAPRAALAAERLPFQQSTPGEDEPDQGDGDGVRHLVGLVGEEGELQDDARYRRSRRPPGCRAGRPARAAAALGPAAASSASGRSGNAAAGDDGGGPERRAAREDRPGGEEQRSVAGASRLRRRLSRIFHREIMGSWLRSRPARVGTKGRARPGSASRRAPSGAAGGRG